MKYATFSLLATLACGVLGACASETPAQRAATIPQPVGVTVPAQPDARPAPEASVAKPDAAARPVMTPLDYYDWAMAATPQELMADRLRLSTRRGPTDPLIDTVHLGILMSLSALASRESEQEALALLNSVSEFTAVSASSREYAIFADLLLSHLQQRADLRAATSSVVESREELETLARDNQQLQEKIDALTSIEEQLIEREQAQGEN